LIYLPHYLCNFTSIICINLPTLQCKKQQSIHARLRTRLSARRYEKVTFATARERNVFLKFD